MSQLAVTDSPRMRWLLTGLTLGMLGSCAIAGHSRNSDATAKDAARFAAKSPSRASASAASTARRVSAFASPPAAVAAAPEATSLPVATPVASATPATPVMPDIDYWATPQPVVDKMLELAQVKRSDVVYDLGCGDARSLVTAARRYGARGVGIDIDPRVVALARDNVHGNGVDDLVTIEQANIFEVDLSAADVVFLYITPRFNLRLVPQFKRMRKGSRIVAHEFEIPGARPVQTLRVPGPPDGPPSDGAPSDGAPSDGAPSDGPPGAAGSDATVLHTIYLWKLPWQKQWTDWK